MLDVSFEMLGVEPERMAALPILNFKLRIVEPARQAIAATPIHSIALRCQVQIEPARRRYAPVEAEHLVELFGTPERWSRTVKPLIWTQTSILVRPFAGTTELNLPISCSYDFSLAATKYFDGVQQGEIPLSFLFSGTVFYENSDGFLQVAQIPWEKEAFLALPVSTWKELMALHFPNTASCSLQKDVFDRLVEFKQQRGYRTLEQAIEFLLAAEQQAVAP
jgi:hypothetical protein